MEDCYDFSKAIKNPFAGKKTKGKFTVMVHYDFNDDGEGGHPLLSEETEAFEEYNAKQKVKPETA